MNRVKNFSPNWETNKFPAKTSCLCQKPLYITVTNHSIVSGIIHRRKETTFPPPLLLPLFCLLFFPLLVHTVCLVHYVAHLEICWTDVFEIWYKYYASVGHPILVHFNSVHFYEACPESKDTKVLNMYSIFNLQKRHCE